MGPGDEEDSEENYSELSEEDALKLGANWDFYERLREENRP